MSKVKCLVDQYDVKAGNIYEVIDNEYDTVGSTCIDVLNDAGHSYTLSPEEYEIVEE